MKTVLPGASQAERFPLLCGCFHLLRKSETAWRDTGFTQTVSRGPGPPLPGQKSRENTGEDQASVLKLHLLSPDTYLFC